MQKLSRLSPFRLVLGLLLVSAVVTGVAYSAETKLNGSVGPGFSISLRDANGAAVTNLTPGDYELEVDDKAEDHNFHLTGPGVDISTSVAAVEKKTFKFALQNGTYSFVCDPHAAGMKGSFTVGAGGSGGSGGSVGSGGTAVKPSAPVGSKLILQSGPGFTIGLKTTAGKKVTRLKPGAYTIVVRDRSDIHNARLKGAGASKATTVPFVGTVTWKVTLKKGTLTFVCDPHATGMVGKVTVAP